MKTPTLLLFLLVVAAPAFSQQWTRQFGMNYVFTQPTGGMKPYMRFGNGFVMDYGYVSPSGRISVGAEFNYSAYGVENSEQLYDFPDGTSAMMNVSVVNSFTNMMATSRIYLKTDGPIRPYAMVKAGYSHFSTNLNINDPDAMDDCEPVEHAVLKKDGTFAYSAGGGVYIDLAGVFKMIQRNTLFFDLSAYSLQGGRIEYMNTDAPPANHQHGSSSTRTHDEVQAEFINTQTKVIHKHHVGYVYSSFLQTMDFRAGISFRIPGHAFSRRGTADAPCPCEN